MSLTEYNKKRDFKKTSEPAGEKKSSSKKLKYVIQEHHASHLHYDLRLEKDGVLKSWAIPKEPSDDPKIKRLAVQVEDHPLGYEKFHGKIPQGNYGAGDVKIWDSGHYETVEENEKSMKIKIHGHKLKGDFALVKTNFGPKKNGWLFFKTKEN